MNPQRKRVFIVEDQRLIAADIANTLKRLGYDVAGHAGSGEEAVAKALDLLPDTILMDIRLEGKMDGIQAASAILQRLDIPIVYLTAYADEETIARAKVTSPFGYLVKPFNERELRAAIEVAIYKHDTERLLADERALRRAAEEISLLVDAIQDYAIFKLDADGRVATWNTGAAKVLGYAAEEVIGQHVSIFYPPGDRLAGRPAQDLDTAVAEDRLSVEGWLHRKDGTPFWGYMNVTTLRDERGRPRGFANITRDLTERKHREDGQAFLDKATIALTTTLEVADTLQRAARLTLPELADWCAIDLADERGRLVPAAIAHLDPEKEELARTLMRAAAPDLELAHGAYHVFRTGRSDIYPDLNDVDWAAQLLGADHPETLRQLGVISYMCVPIRYRGRSQGVVNLLRAAPPRRYAVPDLALAEEFARRVGLALDNANLYEEAQAAIRARDEFLQIASHELKTPLTPLQLQLDALTRVVEKATIQKAQLSAKLRVASQQTARLNRLVEMLLDVGRLTGGGIQLELEEFDFAEMVGELAAAFEPEAKKVKSTLVFRSDGRIEGRWDRQRVEQVVTNLMSNAIKYGAGKPIEVEVRAPDHAVRLEVTDHGIGIEQEALERIFGRFERAVSVRHYGGLGLGLFITRQIVEAHGGTIQAQSQFGVGSRFTVQLPRHPITPSRPG